MLEYTTEQLIETMTKKGYVVFENDLKQYNLNIVGVRNSNGRVNKFDDVLFDFWKYQGEWFQKRYRITTEPGIAFLGAKMGNLNGTAILKPGQYRGCWSVGLHHNKYTALVQTGPVTVYRDTDKDGKPETEGMKEDTGYFGINIHRASATNETQNIQNYSAGCQVFCNPIEYDEHMDMVLSAEVNFGNKFTYTLLEEKDFLNV
jgi:hypothetical protein